MCCVAMVVHTTVESGCAVLAETCGQQVSSTGVLVKEGRDIVDETADADQRAALGLLFELLPRDDGQVVRALWPLEFLLHLVGVL